MHSGTNITALLTAYESGDEEAFRQAFSLVYGELRRLASSQKRRMGGTLDTTGLVHEAYIKLAGGQGGKGRDRSHFMAIAATAMRHLLVDYARSRQRAKRGADLRRVELHEDMAAADREAESLLALDQALTRLAEQEPRWAQVVECRHFAGLSEEETAAAVGVSLRTAQRSWQQARHWLHQQMTAT
jgi:RNA polymerase sigma factor (TIGR02999 family)